MSTTQASLQAPASVDNILSLLDQYAEILVQAGKKARRSPRDEGRRLMEGLTEAQRNVLVARLELELQVFREILVAGEALGNTGRQLWRFLVLSKQTPSSDFFDKLGGADMVQVFGAEHSMQFVSLNFFDYVSFTLEQIFSGTWFTLVRRDSKPLELLYSMTLRILAGEVRCTVDPGNEWHLGEEVESEEFLKFHLKVKWISPLYTGATVSGYVGIVGCERA